MLPEGQQRKYTVQRKRGNIADLREDREKVIKLSKQNGIGISLHCPHKQNFMGTGTLSPKVADIVEKANRAMPGENDVTGHRQRYHTKDGVVWRDKAPYHRGGKD